VFRFAATHPADVLSFTAVEAALAGFGLELLADVAHGGSWHVGFFAAPGIPEILLPGHERQLLARWAYPMMTAVKDAITDGDIDEFTRTYARPDGWRGSEGLYQSIFTDNGQTRALAESQPLAVPVLTVDGVNAPFTKQTFCQGGGVGGRPRTRTVRGAGKAATAPRPPPPGGRLRRRLPGSPSPGPQAWTPRLGRCPKGMCAPARASRQRRSGSHQVAQWPPS
jgi:hypothetical protein